MTIIVSANDHRAAIEALAESSDRNVEIRAAGVGDRLEVTFDEADTKLLQVFISILSSDEREFSAFKLSIKAATPFLPLCFTAFVRVGQ